MRYIQHNCRSAFVSYSSSFKSNGWSKYERKKGENGKDGSPGSKWQRNSSLKVVRHLWWFSRITYTTYLNICCVMVTLCWMKSQNDSFRCTQKCFNLRHHFKAAVVYGHECVNLIFTKKSVPGHWKWILSTTVTV